MRYCMILKLGPRNRNIISNVSMQKESIYYYNILNKA